MVPKENEEMASNNNEPTNDWKLADTKGIQKVRAYWKKEAVSGGLQVRLTVSTSRIWRLHLRAREILCNTTVPEDREAADPWMPSEDAEFLRPFCKI